MNFVRHPYGPEHAERVDEERARKVMLRTVRHDKIPAKRDFEIELVEVTENCRREYLFLQRINGVFWLSSHTTKREMWGAKFGVPTKKDARYED